MDPRRLNEAAAPWGEPLMWISEKKHIKLNHVYDYKSGIDYYDHVFEAESAIDVIHADISLKNENDPVDHAYLSLTSEIDQEVHFELECKRSEDVLALGESKTVFLEKGRTTDVRLNFAGWDDGPYYIYITFENVRIEFKFTP